MCGITGIIAKNAQKYEKIARKMTQSVVHRGPDSDGLKIFDTCILGHRRLSIIDLALGAQPMLNANNTVGVVFNGEIYGFKEIKNKLNLYDFKTSSDTEVILALYQTKGENFIKELPGMFSFGIWDDRNKTFIAARDRFGEKPFYYAKGKNGEFIFGSEIKSIISSGLVTPELDEESLAHYLHKLFVHPNKTIYKNIHVLPAAHSLIYKNGNLKISRYWKMQKTDELITIENAVPEFRRLLDSAVKKQLISDVPVGAFLSGGADSTTIVSIASKLSPHIKTFAFGYEGTKNELLFAKMAADKYGTDHYELHDTEYKIADLILQMGDIYDEPLADSSTISTYIISKLARQHTTVVLSGDGGDELLGGYHGWNRPIMAMTDPNIKNFTGKETMMRLLAQIALRRNWNKKVKVINTARGLHYRSTYKNTVEAHRASNVFFKLDEILSLGIESVPIFSEPSWDVNNSVDDAMRDDLENYLPGDILVKTDRASMANSLELRSPFLDITFAEFAISLPHRLKITDAEDKMILRRAYEKEWPEAIQTRQKQGFGAPVEIWMSKPEVVTLIEEYLNDPKKKIFRYISFEKTRKYILEKKYKLWILLTLSVWMEKHSF